MAVPVHVVGGEIEHGAQRAGQIRAVFELEAGHLQHVELAGWIDQIQRRRPEIAADRHIQTRLLGHGGQQRHHSAFAVGAGHRHHRHLRPAIWSQIAGEEIQVGEHLLPQSQSAAHQGVAGGDARAADHLAAAREHALALCLAHAESGRLQILRLELGRQRMQCRLAALVAGFANHPGLAARRQPARHRQGRGAGAEQQCAVPTHRGNTVRKAANSDTSNSMAVVIQKRMLICVSDQPESSRW